MATLEDTLTEVTERIHPAMRTVSAHSSVALRNGQLAPCEPYYCTPTLDPKALERTATGLTRSIGPGPMFAGRS